MAYTMTDMPTYTLTDLVDRTVAIKSFIEEDSSVIVTVAVDIETGDTFVLDCSILH